MKIRIATRQSVLALWQTHHVVELLQQHFPALNVEIIGMTTTGDQRLDQALNKIGGKGLFVKELEAALLANKADIAVHSMKDMPMDCQPGLMIAAITQRGNPFDALLNLENKDLLTLPKNACVGTASLRRQCQLKHWRPDLQIKLLRGNVPTRIDKLLNHQFDAIVLAAAGLERLSMTQHITQIFSSDLMLPAIGQGAIGIECRADDIAIQKLLTAINDSLTAACLQAERTISQCLGGNCQLPLAGYASIQEQIMSLHGLIGTPGGDKLIRAQCQGSIDQAQALGHRVAEDLIAQGGQEILLHFGTHSDHP